MSWQEAPLDSVCEFIRNGKSVQQSKEINGLPITRIETIAGQSIDSSRVGYAGLSLADSERHLLQSGDILFSHINSLEHIGKTAIYEGHPKGLVHGMNLLSLRPDQSKVDCRYLLHALRTAELKAKFLRIANKSVNQASISAGNLKQLRVPLPPLAEQRRIAAILDAADALRAKRREAITKLDQLLQSVFFEMFGDPIKNQKRINKVALGKLISLRTGKLDANASSEDGEYPFFTCARRPLRIATYSYDCECVLVAGNGDLNVKKYSGKFDAYQRTYIIESIDKVLLSTNYLFHFLDAYLDELRKQSIGGIIKYIKKENLTDAAILLPGAAEQREFNQICDAISDQRQRLESAETQITHLFSTLQHRAFSGTL